MVQEIQPPAASRSMGLDALAFGLVRRLRRAYRHWDYLGLALGADAR